MCFLTSNTDIESFYQKKFCAPLFSGAQGCDFVSGTRWTQFVDLLFPFFGGISPLWATTYGRWHKICVFFGRFLVFKVKILLEPPPDILITEMNQEKGIKQYYRLGICYTLRHFLQMAIS